LSNDTTEATVVASGELANGKAYGLNSYQAELLCFGKRTETMDHGLKRAFRPDVSSEFGWSTRLAIFRDLVPKRGIEAQFLLDIPHSIVKLVRVLL
jgi:hypothetical protein